MSNNTGGPSVKQKATLSIANLDMRDYFAAKAMQGFIQYSATKGIYAPPDDELAKASYQLADAMLKTREGK